MCLINEDMIMIDDIICDNKDDEIIDIWDNNEWFDRVGYTVSDLPAVIPPRGWDYE